MNSENKKIVRKEAKSTKMRRYTFGRNEVIHEKEL